jgi:hypothetical protein
MGRFYFSARDKETHPCTPLKRGFRKAGMTGEGYKKADGIQVIERENYKLLNSSTVIPAWRINLFRIPGPSSLC